MGTAIKATAVSTDPAVHSSIEHAALAADECLRRGGVRPEQVDLLINAGVYRDENMAEPAMSALVQKRIGMNLDYVKDPVPNAGFSFDLMNGACGVLNAVQVAGAFLATGSAGYVLVVSSDAHPSGRRDDDFPYATMGAAMLLERAVDGGFGRLRAAGRSDGGHGAAGYMDMRTAGAGGRAKIATRRDDDYAARLLDFAAEQARACAAGDGLDLAGTLLVASQPTPTFAADLGGRLGVAADAVVTVDGVDGDPHTSALTFAYDRAVADGRADRYPTALFVAAGAGLAVACAAYRRQGNGG